MILYFSGTGNSRYAAKKLAELTEDTVISINERMRRGGLREHRFGAPSGIRAPSTTGEFPTSWKSTF